MQIIPAIDIIGGKCVRLSEGDYSTKKIYNESPLEVAKEFESYGFKRLHLVDLDGAKNKKIVNLGILEAIASNTSLWVDFGGGVRSNEDIKAAFDAGAKQVTGGSIAVKDRSTFESWINQFGGDKIILGADVKQEKIAVSGWEEDSGIDLYDFLKDYLSKGLSEVVCTDVAKDGMLQGPSFDLYKKIKSQFADIKLIASGGVSSIEDVRQLKEDGLFGAIIGKAIYEQKIDLKELSELC